LKDNINEMIRNLKDTTLKNSEQDWLKTNLAKFTRMLQGQKDLLTVGKLILSELAPTVQAQHGVFYIMDGSQPEPTLKLLASYAYRERKTVGNRFKLGEGIVGQAALEKERILLTNVPSDYVQISSGLGAARPQNIIVLPVIFEGAVKAVIELASFERFSATHQVFLDQLVESIGIVLNTIEANTLTEDLLKQSQTLATELQSRQQELQTTNAELQEKAALLADQNAEVERKNREVEQARQALEDKARQLSITSRYKSEFLANMSHELRTPLNSLLILAEQLANNREGNLTDKQVEFSQTIHGSGKDLLRLINDILDLSKIESGTVSVDLSDFSLDELVEGLGRTFRPVAEGKGLSFDVQVDRNLARTIHTDAQRLDQILKNLLSNAFKFTERGGVALRIERATTGWHKDHPLLNQVPTVLAFSVIDTGIGIASEKQHNIFEAFQQADGSTSRKYGGTGLGLTISREIARLLGGEIRLDSVPNQGSTFTLFVPQRYASRPVATISSFIGEEIATTPEPLPPSPAAETMIDEPVWSSSGLADDRATIRTTDQVVLVIEDDIDFAQFEMEVVRAEGLKALVAMRGHAGLALAREYRPNGILLDITLPDVSGWKVLERLKDDLATRHIPVFVVSANDEPENALKHGAVCFRKKPISREEFEKLIARLKGFQHTTRNLLVVEDDDAQRQSIETLIGNGTAHLVSVGSGAEALGKLREQDFDGLVLDLLLPDISGFDLMQQIRREHPELPIIVYTGKDLSLEEEAQLNRVAQTVIVKDVRSPERLYDQATLWLHRDFAELPEEKRSILMQLHTEEGILSGRKVLIVDDDVRNIFAMTSFLERYQMEVIPAETGTEAIAALEGVPGVDIVLMDIMLPEMDGYETIRQIRERHTFKELPIIALTAKAMRGDREKCIEAGASDYIAKPVDTEKLVSMLRMWLHR